MSFVTSTLTTLSHADHPVFPLSAPETVRYSGIKQVDDERRFLDQIDDAAFLLDDFGIVSRVNAPFAEMLGKQVDDLEASELSLLNLKFFDQRQSQLTEINSANVSAIDSVEFYCAQGTSLNRRSVSTMRLRTGIERVLVVIGDKLQIETVDKNAAQSIEELQRAQDELVAQFDALRELSFRDALTGVLNRRSLRDRMQEQHGAASFERNAVLMIDIDHFKKLNDRHGHPVGDEVLCAVAKLIASSVGYLGSVYRYGGEEFCVVMPKALGEEAFALAIELCSIVQSQMESPYGITISAGVSEAAAECRSIGQLIEEADKSLLLAKRSGRNCAKQWSEEMQNLRDNSDGTCSIDLGLEELPISFHAVCALNATLGMCDIQSAVHSHRVADLCAPLAKILLSPRKAYRLEIASIVHEAGRLGMKHHDEYRVPRQEIVKYLCSDQFAKRKADISKKTLRVLESVVTDESVLRMIRLHPQMYSSDGISVPDFSLPIEARILTLCDTYDDLRNGRISISFTHDEAIAVLSLCKGRLLAPDIVELFMTTQLGWRPAAQVVTDEFSGRDALVISYLLEGILQSYDVHNAPRLKEHLQALHRVALRLELRFVARVVCDLAAAVERHAEDDWKSFSEQIAVLTELCIAIQRPYLRSKLY